MRYAALLIISGVTLAACAIDIKGACGSGCGTGETCLSGRCVRDTVAPQVVPGSLVVNGGTPVGTSPAVKWFPRGIGDIDVQVDFQENGSIDTSTLKLVRVTGGSRVDHGIPTCDAANAGVIRCHLIVDRSSIPVSTQQRIDFQVKAADLAGNPLADSIDTAGSLGIDGQPPVITFTIGPAGDTTTTSNYPAAFADCNGGAIDAAMFCGHDGQHFFRAGDGNHLLTFKATDSSGGGDIGSGLDTGSGAATYAVIGEVPKVATYVGNGFFSLPADFSNATFSSGGDGVGTVSVTVTAKDSVGNSATPVTLTGIGVTRLKWMRNIGTRVTLLKASPVFTTKPAPQVIFAGSVTTGDPVVSLSTDGRELWSAGSPDVKVVSNNIAFSSVTQSLYLLGDNAVKLVAYHIGVNASLAPIVNDSYSCLLRAGTTNGRASGAPALITDLGTGVEYALAADSGLHRVWAFTGTFGPTGGCSTPSEYTTAATWLGTVNTPVSNGSSVYAAHDGTSLAEIPFQAGKFGTPTHDPNLGIDVFGSTALGGSLFLGDVVARKLRAFDPATVSEVPAWTATSGAGAMQDALTASPIASGTHVFGVAGSNDGHLRAFSKTNGSSAFTWPVDATRLANVSLPAIGADGVLYFSDDQNKEVLGLKVSGSTPTLANNWSAAFVGAVAPTNTTLDSVTTQPTIDPSGVMYFGTAGGKMFAIITDSGGPLAPQAGVTWPRVGYDNCNSSNTAFSCQ